MALTAKPISTISYNTGEFLKRKLDSMLKAYKITDYRFIFHYGEDGDKDHYHVYIEPNRRLDTAVLRDEFNEITNDSDKPLGCMPFHSSKFDHWIMYVIHDPKYLEIHKSDNDGDGKIEYPLSDIITPFQEQLERDYKIATRLRETENQKIIEQMQQGETLTGIAYKNDINPMRIVAIQNLFRADLVMQEMESLQDSKDDMIREQRQKIEQLKQNQETLMLRDLEQKTGEDLHHNKESVFDE